MAKEETPERSAGPPGMIVTSITVVDLPPVDGPSLREQLAGVGVRYRALGAVAVALGLGALAAIVATAPVTGRGAARSPGRLAQHVTQSERAAVAGALGYPYPLRCLTISVSAGDPDYATASIDRTKGCTRYRGYTNASLHRIDGSWRLVLDEGQLFVPNSLLGPCRSRQAGCAPGVALGAEPSSARSDTEGGPHRYPLGCLSPAIVLHDPRFASPAFDRVMCARPGRV